MRPAPELEPGQALLAVERVRTHLQQHHLRDVRRGDVLLELLPRRGGLGPDAGVGLRRGDRRAGTTPSRWARGCTGICRLRASSSSHRSASARTGSSTPPPTASTLPAAYNRYTRVDADPVYDADTEDQQMLLRPLFFTSYLIDDFLTDSGSSARARPCCRAPRARRRARSRFFSPAGRESRSSG